MYADAANQALPRRLCQSTRPIVCLGKSKLFFSPNFDMDEATRISNVASILVTEDLGQYLGTQLVHHRHGKALYNGLMER